ncbi:MAG: permease [Lentisphaerae bacterium]|nr:permease [Lentisphaerota bacterium]
MIFDVLSAMWQTLTSMAPYLLFGFFIAGMLSMFISPRLVEDHLGGRGVWPIMKASLFGIPLPLCSCSVIPVAASLRRHGAGHGATSAFLISTPQTGVDSILATVSLLGPVFAIFRTLCAFVSGVVGGGIVDLISPETERPKEGPEAECCGGEAEGSRFRRAMQHGFGTLVNDVSGPLLLGLVVAGLISAFVPERFFTDYIGTGLPAMLLMLAMGIPIYVCATASIPIAAAMILKGVSPGAALVFLMTGPATNAAAITTIWRMFGARAGVAFLLSVGLTALGSGLLMDIWVPADMLRTAIVTEAAHTSLPGRAAAVVLLVILLRPWVARLRARATSP